MLQDLDARQTAANEATNLYTKPVARREDGVPLPVLVGAAVGVAVLAAAGAFGWRYWQKAHQPQAVPVPVRVVSLSSAPALAPAPAAAVPAAPAPEPAPIAKEETVAAPPPVTVVEAPKAATAPRRHKERDLHKREALAAKPAAAEAKAKASASGKEETAAQKAETGYRRALASIQEGYVNEAVVQLEQALQANPRHDAARQTLVSLLIENKRSDEAMRQLQLGLTLDPAQPALAMLLARLQIEHGGTGIDTLTRTLPYVGANGEYRAFLAGALQRQQRHREAAEQYQAALRSAPQNGVWWMGLGISLQAEKRDAEALDAFRKAKGSATLAPELLAFVENKIQQLSR
ncbi:hypothetical protein GCM10027318_23360 [Massilia agilis]|nr:tetratricopeptide repeat protein [Massilia agilis]